MKIIRCATIGMSLNIFCNGILTDLKNQGFEVVALSSEDEDLKELALREGVRTIGVEMDRHISPLKDLRSLCRLIRVFYQEKPDMVHSMTPKAGLLCMMAAWMARVPVRVHTFTGLVWPTATGLTRRILMLTDKITCSCATHVIPESQGVLHDLRDYKITNKPMKILGYGNIRGIDLSYWSNTKEKLKSERVKELKSCIAGPNSESLFTFLFVGRIVGDKGINELVSAFSRLLTQVKKVKRETGKEVPGRVRLVLVGPYEDHLDPVSAETRRMIDSMPEIEAVGPQFGEELKAWYADADCFVFPSYREGFPNTVLEAGAMELASIVTDINGSNEIITSVSEKVKELESERVRGGSQHLLPEERMSVRENGVVIPSKDADALYDAMIWMMEHPEERQKMGKRAREIVSERWEQGFVRQQLYDFYHEVMIHV